MSLYLNLNSRLTITNPETKQSIVFNHIAEAEIKRSIRTLGDTAYIVIPRNYGMLRKKETFNNLIRVGFKVKLELGYNGSYYTEFSGYLREVESGFPVKLYADDELYQFRKNKFIKSWKSVTLKQLLTELFPNYKIECLDMNLGAYIIDNASAVTVLRKIMEQYELYTLIDNDTIRCDFAAQVRSPQKHNYNFSKNVKKSSLKYRRKEDTPIRIKAKSKQSNGKDIAIEIGSSDFEASERTLNCPANLSKEELTEFAQRKLDSLAFDGFDGSITGFGYPRVNAGDTLNIISKKEPERNGSYLVESLTIRYGCPYYERICDLSYKITSENLLIKTI